MIDENVFFYETFIQLIGPTRSHLARFACARFALRPHENFWKKRVSQSTRNALKRMEMQKKKKNVLPFWPIAQSASDKAQPYLPHVTRRVPRRVHAKFHADWTKTVGARGIHRQSYFNNVDEHTLYRYYRCYLQMVMIHYFWPCCYCKHGQVLISHKGVPDGR